MNATFPKIPNFEVVSRLGVGGMGRVYLCRSLGAYGFKKLLAVKVINPHHRDKEAVRAMFLDEARLVAQLDHPAIAQVFDFGESDESLYLVMEYVAGISVADTLIKEIRLPPLICASICAGVCRGLHAAHEAKGADGKPLNVVHRDVTPSNLVLTFSGQVKILDFGIALMRERSAPVTVAGQIRGKPTYLSPEQFEGGVIDRRTDLYSLSIVLHELLTLEKLFTMDDYVGPTTIPRNWKDVAAAVKPPSDTAGRLPPGLDDIVMKGLAVDPADRFHDAKAMALALEEVVDLGSCETLEAFADRELADLRAAHDERLRSSVDDSESDAQPGAPDQPQTLDANPPVLELDTEPSADKTPSLLSDEVALEQPATTVVGMAPVPRARRRWVQRALIIAGLLVLLGGAAVVMRGRPTSPPLSASTRAPAPDPPPAPSRKKRTVRPISPARAVTPPPVTPPPAPVEANPAPGRRPIATPRPKKKRKPSREISSDGIMQQW